MQTSSVTRVSSALFIATVMLGGCSMFSSDKAEPTSNASAVGYDTFGPSKPDSGFGSTGNVIVGGSTGVFGTTDPITVDDSGPFPANSTSFDPSLSDYSAADQELLAGTGLDLSAESALASTITFSGDDGSQAFFDADIGTTVYFDTNSTTLSDEAREILRKQAAWLNVHPNVSATIEGHADERGTREYNIALGEQRASAVRGYFTALGVDGDRIRKISFGKERPVVNGSDESAWSQNRRTETVLEPQNGGFAGIGSGIDNNATYLAPSSTQSSIDSLLNDPVLNGLPLGDPLLNDPLLNDPLLNDI